MNEANRRVRRRGLGIALAVAGVMVAGRAHAGATINIYSAAGLEVFYKKVLPAFEKKTGAHVNVLVNGAGVNINRMETEKDSPKADLFVALPPFSQEAAKKGLIAPYMPAAGAKLPATLKDPKGAWVSFMNNYFSFIYNPKLTKAPQTFDDLLHAPYQGNVSYSNPTTAGDGMGLIILLDKVWGEDKAFDYLKKLEGSIKFHTKGTGFLDVLVGRGEIHVANGDFQMDMDDKVHGGLAIQPIFLRPAPGARPVTFEVPYNVQLVKGGPNPKGAKALIDYLLSKKAQAMTSFVFGLPVRGDVHMSGPNAGKIEAAVKDVEIAPVDWDHIIASLDHWKKRWRDDVIGTSTKPLDRKGH